MFFFLKKKNVNTKKIEETRSKHFQQRQVWSYIFPISWIPKL